MIVTNNILASDKTSTPLLSYSYTKRPLLVAVDDTTTILFTSSGSYLLQKLSPPKPINIHGSISTSSIHSVLFISSKFFPRVLVFVIEDSSTAVFKVVALELDVTSLSLSTLLFDSCSIPFCPQLFTSRSSLFIYWRPMLFEIDVNSFELVDSQSIDLGTSLKQIQFSTDSIYLTNYRKVWKLSKEQQHLNNNGLAITKICFPYFNFSDFDVLILNFDQKFVEFSAQPITLPNQTLISSISDRPIVISDSQLFLIDQVLSYYSSISVFIEGHVCLGQNVVKLFKFDEGILLCFQKTYYFIPVHL
ncbi:hypothetical protein GEMRC1_011827 [Eukaryota sp. GEM-RC1]